eukprot:CAMPEP_0197193320 /NCGR_PEP_ID=MMETSP1423-20130617/26933_1 /TAXON_ID=476441 /ORGANISM="Pseudo-nitzschia heimii, Strain UNC1101" /LENGTH=192 /DNA_ID=CAMNT_0042646489 /DNA_START=77 /DNA_END=655 /DNA_ORIENTATION=+
MSMSENAEENDANQSKFYRVISSEPVTDAGALFETLSKFLMNDKKRQISSGYLDERDEMSSRLIWNNLRNVANSISNDGGLLDQPVPAWIDQKEAVVIDGDTETLDRNSIDSGTRTKQEDEQQSQQTTALTNRITNETIMTTARTETKEEKRTAKKAKKAAKESRKRERAEKREAKRVRKEAKKLKKEAKKM